MENNVVSLFNRLRAQEPAAGIGSVSLSSVADNASVSRVSNGSDASTGTGEAQPSGFAELADRNRANQERLRKEREQANKSVLKSYRIK